MEDLIAFEIGDKVKVALTVPLPGNEVAPPLEMGEEKDIKEVLVCSCGSKHLDVGLKSMYNYVTCFECREELPRGDSVHWCHPSRFIKV